MGSEQGRGLVFHKKIYISYTVTNKALDKNANKSFEMELLYFVSLLISETHIFLMMTVADDNV